VSDRTLVAVALLASVTLGACGGSTTTADADVTSALTTTPRFTRVTIDVAPTLPPGTSAPTTPPAPATIAPTDTVALPPDQCPNGSWWVDPAGLGPFGAFGSSADMTATSTGRFIVEFADGRYTITADEFSLELITPTSEIGISTSGSASGSFVTGTDMLTFIETSFDMMSDVRVNGETVDGNFINEAFHQTFGSGTIPYTCNTDGTLTITYDAPTGPAPGIHRPL
jgi:hypothetical protein